MPSDELVDGVSHPEIRVGAVPESHEEEDALVRKERLRPIIDKLLHELNRPVDLINSHARAGMVDQDRHGPA